MTNEIKNYIQLKMKEFAMNIDEFQINDTVLDITDNTIATITDKGKNSLEVFILKKTEKGINCYQWYDMKTFNRIFKKYSTD